MWCLIRHEKPISEQNTVSLRLGYRATVHKTQRLTVDKILYYMEITFAAGQAHVAFRRVTSLSGLFPKNMKPRLVYRNEYIHANLINIEELNCNCENVDDIDFITQHTNYKFCLVN